MISRDLLRAVIPAPVWKLAQNVRGLSRMASARGEIRKLLSGSTPIKLELGSGPKKGKGGWTTIDRVPVCDIYHDLAHGIPFPDKTVEDIYSSHFFEHLTYVEAQKMLDECMRVLVAGGRFSICVPNAELYVRAYSENAPLDGEKCCEYKPAFNNTTGIDYLNYIAYMDGQHKYMFDKVNLVFILQQKGLRDVRIREFDPTLDVASREVYSIYAEGFK